MGKKYKHAIKNLEKALPVHERPSFNKSIPNKYGHLPKHTSLGLHTFRDFAGLTDRVAGATLSDYPPLDTFPAIPLKYKSMASSIFFGSGTMDEILAKANVEMDVKSQTFFSTFNALQMSFEADHTYKILTLAWLLMENTRELVSC